jgi:hypothetical protein
VIRTEAFDGKALIETLRDRHGCRSAFKNGGKNIGIVGSFDQQSFARKGASNAEIITTVATTNRVDLEREVVLPEGGVFDYLLANRKVFADHNYSHEYCVGGLARWDKAPRGWKMTVGVLMNHPYPVPAAMLNMAAQIGVGASIGFECLEGGKPDANEKRLYPGAEYIVRKWNCLEVSLTALPCNVDCQSFTGNVDRTRAADAVRLLDLGEQTETARKLLRLQLPMLSLA